MEPRIWSKDGPIGICVYLDTGGTRWFRVSSFAEAAWRTTVRRGCIVGFKRVAEQDYVSGGWKE